MQNHAGCALAFALVVAVGPAEAQGPASPSTLPALPPAGVEWSGARPVTPADTLPCPECHPPKRFWFGVADLMFVQLLPYGINNLYRQEVWARVSPTTWRNNLVYPWQWDDNMFSNNQWAHPYHGSLYYNSARTNGYNFWQSSLWPVAGSLMWELFFEAWAPAPNDFVTTSVGGVILGETLYRLSRLPLDNTTTGGARVWREVASGILDPISGLNRLVRGETGRVSANPPDWRPKAMFGLMDLGYRQTTDAGAEGEGQETVSQWNATFSLSYGSPVTDLNHAPFSHFALRADLAGPNESGVISQVSARGNLAAWALGQSGKHQVALLLEYDYFNNPAFVYGGQSVQAGLVSTLGAPGTTWWGQLNFLFNGVLLGATQSDYYTAIEGRNYDYGPGLGTILSARFLYKSRVMVSAAYTGLWIHTIDGVESSHYQDALLAEGRYWFTRSLGLGVSYANYNRRSDYAGLDNVVESADFIRAFASAAFPGLPR